MVKRELGRVLIGGSWLLAASCADLLGLEPGVLASGGNSSSGASGAVSAAGGGALPGGNASLGGDGSQAQMGGSAGVGSAEADAGNDAGGAGMGGVPTVADGGEQSTGPCKYGTCSECPEDMVQSMSHEAYRYCIDRAEVTNEQYLAFTSRYDTTNVVGSTACAGNDTLLPDIECSTALSDIPSRELPVVCVDFCDAEAYCSMKGKRLCGRVGGVMNDPGDNANGAASEWYAACAGLSDNTYPYGEAASETKCNGSGYSPSDMGPRDVETLSECEGSVGGLYNMSGNVAEWEWSCSSTGVNATCSTRGGSYLDGPYELRCTGSIGLGRMDASASVGFRCCANLDQ
jgi:formylglycine-generating enzyme